MAVRVLIVDDSVVARRWLTELLTADASIEVVGSAATAAIGIQKIEQVAPDVVLLDVEMPEMDGIEAVRRIRAQWPKLPVIMCSSLTELGAETTLRALAAGATDYIAKPSALGRGDQPGVFGAEVIAKVKAIAIPTLVAKAPAFVTRQRGGCSVTAIGIGSSTGGPNALGTLFGALPRDLPVPIFIVQHMPPLFTRLLAERLSATSGLRVVEAQGGEVAEPGCAYIAPGNFHMVVHRDGTRVRIALNQESPENSCRPAVDVLFRSLANVYGQGVLAAVLTGMGHDGGRGAQDIHDVGGTILVQDAASCVVPSMPASVAQRGIASGEYPIEQIGHELVVRARGGRGQVTASLRPGSVESSRC